MEVVLGAKGHLTKTISNSVDMDRRTTQMWVARFNKGSISGLRDLPGGAGHPAQDTGGSRDGQ